MTEWEKLTYKKFSIGHPDKQTMIPENNFQGKLYYTFFKNSPQKTIDEIYDIYFGKFFHAKTKRGTTVSWGNVMGVEASDMALDWLFRVQEDFGVPISLTMNQLNVPFDLYNDEDVITQFIDWVGEFYNRGLRSITIGNTAYDLGTLVDSGSGYVAGVGYDMDGGYQIRATYYGNLGGESDNTATLVSAVWSF